VFVVVGIRWHSSSNLCRVEDDSVKSQVVSMLEGFPTGTIGVLLSSIE